MANHHNNINKSNNKTTTPAERHTLRCENILLQFKKTCFSALGQEGEQVTGGHILQQSNFIICYYGGFSEAGNGQGNENRFKAIRGRMHGYSITTVLISDDSTELKCVEKVARMQVSYFIYPANPKTRRLYTALGGPPMCLVINDSGYICHLDKSVPTIDDSHLGLWDNFDAHFTLVETGKMKEKEAEEDEGRKGGCCPIL